MLWNEYYKGISNLNSTSIKLPSLPKYATNNGHMFYIVTKDIEHRTKVINTLKENGFHAVFHYISLHSSDYYTSKHDGRSLPHSDKFTDCLLRLPLFYELNVSDIAAIVASIA